MHSFLFLTFPAPSPSPTERRRKKPLGSDTFCYLKKNWERKRKKMVPFVLCNNHSRLIRVYVCSFCSLFSSLKQTFRSLHISLFSIDCTVIITLGLFFIFIFIFYFKCTPHPLSNYKPPSVCLFYYFFFSLLFLWS